MRHLSDIFSSQMVQRVYTPRFLGQTGVYAKHVRKRRFHVPQPASKSILTRWQSARSPCRARALVFFGHIGANGTVAHEGSKGPPVLATYWRDMPPQPY